MRRSNPTGCFQSDKTNTKNSFKDQVRVAGRIDDNKSEATFHKPNSKKRMKSRRKNSKPKIDCKSTREVDDKSKNFGVYGSILQNTRNKRESISRPNDKEDMVYYKDKYSRMKRMYEYERNTRKTETEELAKENKNLKKKIHTLKQDNQNQNNEFQKELEAMAKKLEYYEDILRGRSRQDSASVDMSRSLCESKTGESTIESDKLSNMLKNKEENIRMLMQELKQSNTNDTKLDESKILVEIIYS